MKVREVTEMDIKIKSTRIKRLGLLLSTVLVMSAIAVSCGDDPASTTMEPIEDVSFSADVQPIFNGSCGGSGCHVGSTQNGVNLSSYAQVMNSVGQQYGTEIVEAGEPDQSPLVDKIEPSPDHGERMPLGRAPLDDQQIEKIRVWIAEGALEN